jgi:hypothetical protein
VAQVLIGRLDDLAIFPVQQLGALLAGRAHHFDGTRTQPEFQVQRLGVKISGGGASSVPDGALCSEARAMDLPAGTGAAAWLTGLLADTVLWGATLQHTYQRHGTKTSPDNT